MKAHGPLPIILAPILYAIFIPVGILLFFLNEAVRWVVSIALQIRYRGKVKLISDGNDGIWGGFYGKGTVRNVLVAGFLKSRKLTIENCAKEFQERVLDFKDEDGKRPYAKFEKILTKSFAYSCWKDCDNFDLRNHYRLIEPSKIHNKEDLQEILFQLTKDMAGDKPQWETVIIQRYRENEDAAEKMVQIYRFQHAYMDGLSLVSMLKTHLADNFEYTIDPLNFSIPMWKRIFFYVNYIIYAPYFFLLLLWSKLQGPNWIKNENQPGRRSIIWTKDIDLGVIRKIRTETRCSYTNIVSTAFVLALKKILPPSSVIDEVVIGELAAMLPYPDSSPQNRFTVFSYSIPTKTEDPLDKIRRVKVDSLAGAIGPQTLLYYLTFKFFGRFPPILLSAFFSGSYESLFLSNVPASKTKFKLFGTDVEEFAAWPPLPNRTGISIASLSYKGSLKICGMADSSWLTKEEQDRIYKEIPRIIYSMADLEYPEHLGAITANETENTDDDGYENYAENEPFGNDFVYDEDYKNYAENERYANDLLYDGYYEDDPEYDSQDGNSTQEE